MNEIRNHSKSNKYFIIENPNETSLNRVQTLVKGGWAKIQSNGWLVIHNNFRSEFEVLTAKEAAKTAIVPQFTKIKDIENWVEENINSGVGAAWLIELSPRQWNELCAGMTAAALNDFADRSGRA